MELNAENIINEIQSLIKALKDCGGWVKRGNGEGWFNHEILADALALITSQEQRIKELEYTLEGVMHSVDKWLDGAELEQNEVNRAATMREKTLQIIERLTEENERWRNDWERNQSQWEEAYEKLEDENAKQDEAILNALKEMGKIRQETKADTVHKMLERISEHATNGHPRKVRLDVVEKIAKEMLEDG